MGVTERVTSGPPSIYSATRADPSRYFSKEEVAKSKAYNRPLGRLRTVSGLLTLAAIVWLILGRAAPSLLERLEISAWPIQVLVVNSTLFLFFYLLRLPTSVYTTFVHEKKWEFSTTTKKTWIADQIKGLIIGLILLNALVLVLWAIIRATSYWWLVGALFFVAFNVLLAAIFPVVLLPIFQKLTPAEDEDLRVRMRKLAEKGGIKLKDVMVMDASRRTRHDNAFFTGMGKTKKVVIFDNMLDFDKDALDVVVAHEVGHWKHRHLIKNVGLATVITLLMFWALRLLESDVALTIAGVSGIGDPGIIPMFFLAFGFVGFLTGFIGSWQSRAHERQADLFALDLTKDQPSFDKAFRTFSSKDLPDLAPNAWKRLNASHPPLVQRLAFAEAWAASRS